MTPTQIARRSDALYEDNTGSMTRRVLCDMVAQREADIESLKAKNTKLQEQGERLFDKTLELGTENSKLLELVARLMGHVKYPPCDGCSFECDGTDLTRCDEWSFMEADARELGVEVDE